MPKIEKVTGVVALSYLVIIPVLGWASWKKIQELDNDVTILWKEVYPDAMVAPSKKIFNPLDWAFKNHRNS